MQNNILDNLPLFKCRASKAGDLMTASRNGKGMGETAKTYLKEWVIQQISGRQKEIPSKYLEKGKDVEHLVLERASRYFGCEFVKNDIQLENEFFTGEFDAKNEIIVIDAKAPYDEYTFPYFIKEVPKGYYNQLQIYMDLTGLKKAALFYGLENGTEEEIDKKSWKIAKSLGKDEPDIEDWEEAKRLLSFDHIPEFLRQKTFVFDRDDKLIDDMKEKVIESREVIKTELLPQLKRFEIDFLSKKI